VLSCQQRAQLRYKKEAEKGIILLTFGSLSIPRKAQSQAQTGDFIRRMGQEEQREALLRQRHSMESGDATSLRPIMPLVERRSSKIGVPETPPPMGTHRVSASLG